MSKDKIKMKTDILGIERRSIKKAEPQYHSTAVIFALPIYGEEIHAIFKTSSTDYVRKCPSEEIYLKNRSYYYLLYIKIYLAEVSLTFIGERYNTMN